ncbi:MAG: DUF1330 domain-containing protein [Gemmatimonadetes bacterium]|nr:DUF1330 domain-containing protein [Gemmatimonadota bacterium]
MTAYVIVEIDVTDPDNYERYKELAGPSVGAYGGRYAVRGGQVEILEGDWDPVRVVVLEFPSMERAKEWWSSDDYAPAKQIRQASADTKMILVAGT